MAKEFKTKSFPSGLVRVLIVEGGVETPFDGGRSMDWQEAESLSKAFHGIGELGNLSQSQKDIIALLIA